MKLTRRLAKRRGWDGPYRYALPTTAPHSGHIHGWIVKRGRKWLHFISIRDGRKRLPLSEERYMIEV